MVAETLAPGQTADVLVVAAGRPPRPPRSTRSTTPSLAAQQQHRHRHRRDARVHRRGRTPPSGDTVGPTTQRRRAHGRRRAAPTPLTASRRAATGNATIAGGRVPHRLRRRDRRSRCTAVTRPSTSPTEAGHARRGRVDTIRPGQRHAHDLRARPGLPSATGAPSPAATIAIDRAGPTTSALTLTRARRRLDPGRARRHGQRRRDRQRQRRRRRVLHRRHRRRWRRHPLTLNKVAPTVSLTATIPAPGLVPAHGLGPRPGCRRQLGCLRHGRPSTVDATGPATSGRERNPPANNGTLPVRRQQPVRPRRGLVDDARVRQQPDRRRRGLHRHRRRQRHGLPVHRHRRHLQRPDRDRLRGHPADDDHPAASGNHTIYVHGKDAAGNWGATSSTILVIEKTRPDDQQHQPRRSSPSALRVSRAGHVLGARHGRRDRQLQPCAAGVA